MPMMKEQFQLDWRRANEVDTQILCFNVPLSTGVKILDSLIPKIEMDMKILDKEKYSEIRGKVEKYTAEFNVEAEKIKAKYERETTTNDPYEETGLKDKLNNLKHTKQQKILVDIQEIGYKAGWWD